MSKFSLAGTGDITRYECIIRMKVFSLGAIGSVGDCLNALHGTVKAEV